MGVFSQFREGSRKVYERTSQQEAFIQAVLGGTGNAFALKALAGTGKTSTLAMLAEDAYKMFPVGEKPKILYLVYGKRQAEEAERRLKGIAQAMTTHKWALRVLRKNEAIEEWNQDSVGSAWKKMESWVEDHVPRNLRFTVNQISEVAAESAVGLDGGLPDTVETFVSLLKNYPQCRFPKNSHVEEVAALCRAYFWQSIATDPPSFGEMLWKFVAATDPNQPEPMTWENPDLLMVDEIQDFSTAQRLLLMRLANPHFGDPPVVAMAGDPNQAIFGWRAADADSYRKIVQLTGAEAFPLTISWRCSRAVIREAQRLVPEIEASETAEEGDVSVVSPEDFNQHIASLLPEPGESLAVLCRNNAPLWDLALRLFELRIPIKFNGGKRKSKGEIQYVLWDVYRGHKGEVRSTANFADFIKRKAAELADTPGKLEVLLDDVETVRLMVEAALKEYGPQKSIETLAVRVEAIWDTFFRPSGSSRFVTLSTIHAAKGLEYTDCVLLTDQLPARSAKRMGGQLLEQEKNLFYVMITRARRSITYISDAADPFAAIMRRFEASTKTVYEAD